MKILKTKWYVWEPCGDRRLVHTDRTFRTEARAYNSMFEVDQTAISPDRPSQLPMKRKLNFIGWGTVSGKRILQLPRLYVLALDAERMPIRAGDTVANPSAILGKVIEVTADGYIHLGDGVVYPANQVKVVFG